MNRIGRSVFPIRTFPFGSLYRRVVWSLCHETGWKPLDLPPLWIFWEFLRFSKMGPSICAWAGTSILSDFFQPNSKAFVTGILYSNRSRKPSDWDWSSTFFWRASTANGSYRSHVSDDGPCFWVGLSEIWMEMWFFKPSILPRCPTSRFFLWGCLQAGKDL